MKSSEKITLSLISLSHLLVHAQMMVFPTLLLVFNREFSLGMDSLGLMVTCSLFMFGLGAIPAGILERRWGGKMLLLVYQIGSIIGGLTIILAQDVIQITLGLAILGLSSSIYHPAGLTILSKSINNLSKGMAVHGIAGSIGLALGPLLAGTTAEFGPWQLSYLIFVLTQFCLLILTYFYIDSFYEYIEEINQQNDVVVLNNDKFSIILYFIVVIALGFSFGGFTSYMPSLFAMQTDGIFQLFPETFKAGFFTTLVFLSGIVGQSLGGYLGDKYNRSSILLIIMIINIPILVLMGFSTGWYLFFLSIGLGVTYFSNQPISNVILADLTSNNQRGIGYGIAFFLSFGVGGFSPSICGLIIELFSINMIFPFMAISLIPGLVAGWFLDKRFKYQHASQNISLYEIT